MKSEVEYRTIHGVVYEISDGIARPQLDISDLKACEAYFEKSITSLCTQYAIGNDISLGE